MPLGGSAPFAPHTALVSTLLIANNQNLSGKNFVINLPLFFGDSVTANLPKDAQRPRGLVERNLNVLLGSPSLEQPRDLFRIGS